MLPKIMGREEKNRAIARVALELLALKGSPRVRVTPKQDRSVPPPSGANFRV